MQRTIVSSYNTATPNDAITSWENLVQDQKNLINRTFVFNNLLHHQGFPNEFQRMNDNFYFMLRQEAFQLMDYIDSVDQFGRIVDLGKSLFGSGGTGKSALLFYISNYCKFKNWIVLFLPFDSNSSEDVFTDRKAEEIVQRFLADNPEIMNEIDGKLQGTEKLLKLLNFLYSQTERKVLIAIDQWNVFLQKLRERKNKDVAFLDFFNTFQTSGDLENGIFIGAFSSQSCYSLPLDVFPDATKQSSGIILKACSNEEFKGHIDLAFHSGMLKEIPTNQKVDDYFFQTGGIPRLLYWAISGGPSFK